MICKNRIKNHTKTPICSGLLFFKDTLKSDDAMFLPVGKSAECAARHGAEKFLSFYAISCPCSSSVFWNFFFHKTYNITPTVAEITSVIGWQATMP